MIFFFSTLLEQHSIEQGVPFLETAFLRTCQIGTYFGTTVVLSITVCYLSDKEQTRRHVNHRLMVDVRWTYGGRLTVSLWQLSDATRAHQPPVGSEKERQLQI